MTNYQSKLLRWQGFIFTQITLNKLLSLTYTCQENRDAKIKPHHPTKV